MRYDPGARLAIVYWPQFQVSRNYAYFHDVTLTELKDVGTTSKADGTIEILRNYFINLA